MKVAGRCIVVLALFLATGCISKPAPWTPGAGDAEVMSGEQRSADGNGEIGVNPVDGKTEVPSPVDVVDALPDGDVCAPGCAGKTCGENGCGGTCGVCEAGSQCVSGTCKKGICAPVWTDGFDDAQAFGLLWTADWHSKFVSKTVVDTGCLEGAGCLYVEGKLGDCWAGAYHRSLGVELPLRLSLALRRGPETLSGCSPRFNFVSLLASVSQSNSVGTELLRVGADGNMVAGGKSLGVLGPDVWRSVEILVSSAGEGLAASFQIDGSEAVSTSPPLPAGVDAHDLVLLSLGCGEGSCFFDVLSVAKCQ